MVLNVYSAKRRFSRLDEARYLLNTVKRLSQHWHGYKIDTRTGTNFSHAMPID